MTRDDIIRMAREAGFDLDIFSVKGRDCFERFAALVAEHEREALFQAQNAAIGLTRQLEIYEAALEQIILCREDSLEATKAKQALAQVRGVLL